MSGRYDYIKEKRHVDHPESMISKYSIVELKLNSRNAVDNRAHGQAQSAPRAVVSDVWNVGLRVERDGLVPGVVAGHVALSAVYAHVLKNDF
jgi:hypothetical protein